MHDNSSTSPPLKAGACGYVLKSAADEDLIAACRAAMRGESFLYASVAGTLVRDFLERMRRGERIPKAVLTAREEEVVKLIAEGHSSKEIAATLVISYKTVERHRSNVLVKLGMRDRTELTRYAICAGLIEPCPGSADAVAPADTRTPTRRDAPSHGTMKQGKERDERLRCPPASRLGSHRGHVRTRGLGLFRPRLGSIG
jgi:DNA-binding CsgD family transcriptional regulator